jgi:hypothetical protein
MNFSFKYQEFEGLSYPSCSVDFFVNNKIVTLAMIVDSGADITLIPKSIGQVLNLQKTHLNYLGGIGGKTGFYLNIVNAKIAGKQIKIPVAWITHDSIPLLLGRKGVFNQFSICFKEKEQVVVFSS